MKFLFYFSIFLYILLILFFIFIPVLTEANFNCEFSNPINIGDATTSDFEFSNLNCTNTETELIAGDDNEFFLSKTWNYGELFIAFLIFLFLIFEIGSKIFNFFFEKMIKIKTKNK